MYHHREHLQASCSEHDYRTIRSFVHNLNRTYYNSLNNNKNSKLQTLRDERSNSIHELNHANGKNSKLVVTIPPDLELTDDQRSVLSKGLKFVPVQPKVDEFQTLLDTEKFYRRMRLKAHFHEEDSDDTNSIDNTDDEFTSLKERKSTWTPREGEFSTLDLYIEKCRHDISQLNLKQHVNHTNLTASEKSALQSLRSNSDLVIKPADKGGATVVWRKYLYLREANRQLSDTNSYHPLPEDPTSDQQSLISDTIHDLIKEKELPPIATNLLQDDPRSARLYLLPKIHKPNNPGRPVVSNSNCPTEIISRYLDNILAPIVQTLPTYIKDTTHALNIFNQYHFTGQQRHIFSMDVKALYTSIPINDGLIALRHFLDIHNSSSCSTTTLLRLAELVLNTATFEFNEKYYSQISGIAMGSPMGGSFACLFIGYLEEQIFNSFTGTKPDLFKRYIDDCVGACSCSIEELQDFINFVCNFHPAIQFTHETSATHLPFLDIKVSIVDDHLSTSVFYKDTDSHSFLTYNSSHPPACKNNIPYSQILRLRRLCQEDDDFNTKATDMTSFFHDRGYPTAVTSAAIRKASDVTRTETLEPSNPPSSDRVPLVITYHPINAKVAKIIQKNSTILQADQKTNAIFTSKPLCAYRKDQSLRDQLVRSSNHEQQLPASTTPCHRSRCNTCAHVFSTDTITGPKGTITIKGSHTCTTTNVVYCIKCSRCNLLYIGETKRRLADRFTEHLRSIRLHQPGLPIANHFQNHRKEDISVTIVSKCSGNDQERKLVEQRIIYKLGTLNPNGLNVSFNAFKT
jgi:hypothetical protein